MHRTFRVSRLVILVFLIGLLAYLLWGRGTGDLEEVKAFGSNPGAIRMYRYVPAGLPPGAPLVVALHGCDQDAKSYGRQAGWNALADRYRFAVLYPETGISNHPMRCWNWFRPRDQVRDGGEAHSVKQMVDAMIAAHRLDGERVFVTGLSAGGAMANALLAVYPDVFAGGAVMAGVAYGCASSVLTAAACMNGTRTLDDGQLLGAARRGYAGYTGPYPVVSVWQGTADVVVSPVNAEEIALQWRKIHGVDSRPAETEIIQGSRRRVYRNDDGREVVEVWEINGMGHGISVDPDGTGGEAGGVTGPYAFDMNIWSSHRAAVFWGLIRPGDRPGSR